jgi:ferredoxin, 2Fe-2S
MAEITVIRRDGSKQVLELGSEMSLMEVIRDAGIDDLTALCGGSCSCATCHVYVDPSFAPRLPPICDGEKELLEGVDNYTDTSRLACQIPVTSDLDGLAVRIPADG